MRKLEEQTLMAVRDQMAAHPWSDADVAELVNPRHGVISGLQQLLRDLEALRRVDLGAVSPAEGIQRNETTDAGA